MKKFLMFLLLMFPCFASAAEITFNNSQGADNYTENPIGEPKKINITYYTSNIYGDRYQVYVRDLVTNSNDYFNNTTHGFPNPTSSFSTFYIDLRNGKHLILTTGLQTGSNMIYFAWVYDTSDDSFSVFKSNWGAYNISDGYGIGIASGVDNNGDFIIYGSSNGCYNVSQDNTSCDFTNINLSGTSYIDIPYGSNSDVYNLQWYQGVFYWLGTVGDLNINYFDLSNNVSINREVILNFSVIPQHYNFKPYFLDISENRVDFFISIAGDRTYNFSYDLDDEYLIEGSPINDYVVGFDGNGELVSIPQSSAAVNNTSGTKVRNNIVYFKDSGGTYRVGYYKNNTSKWVYDTGDTPSIISISAPNPGGGTGGTGTGSVDKGFLNVVWDTDGDGDISWGESISGIGKTIVGVFQSIGNFFSSLYELIIKLNDIFTIEEKTFSFIPIASAAESDYLTSMFPDKETGGYNDSVLGKIEKFFYAAIVMIVFIIGIAGFISINKE